MRLYGGVQCIEVCGGPKSLTMLRSNTVQAEARHGRNDHPNRRIQRRDGHIQEHKVQCLGRWWYVLQLLTPFTHILIPPAGQDKIRPLWRHYFSGTQGLIFVIDSSDSTRLDEAKNELARIIQDREMKDALLLVFANKQDIRGGML